MEMLRFICVVVWALGVNGLMPDSNGGTICAKHRSAHANFNDEVTYVPSVEDDPQVPYQRCMNENSHCYTFWTQDPNNGTVHIIGQGCWVSSGDSHDCQETCIADREQTKPRNNTKFCCCKGNMCNTHFKYIPAKEQTTLPPLTVVMQSDPVLPYIISAGIFLSAIFGSIVVLVCRWRPKKGDIEQGNDTQLTAHSEYNLHQLKLLELIGQGRYGSVWKGVADDQEIAVKVFPAHHRHYFLNEHELYKAAGEHSSLLKCFGGGERATTPSMSDYMLIFSLEQECLQEYLRKYTVDMATLSKMALGVAKGLAHLHSDLGKNCIAHRDLNTRNILVRSDLTCCICDLGLAVVPRQAENRSLSEAGTLRYMAPEVLEGAVNLRDCESALKQIDVYSLGLILWELGSRCVDLQSNEPNAYAPPFWKEIGGNPSLEQMQTLVSRHKARPLWPASWKDTAAAKFLAETAEDCWDQDAEARLTSLCVEERLMELPHLRSLHHPILITASPTPLINNNHLHDCNDIDASIGTIETLLSPTEEYAKNSNQLAACVTPLQPHQGRNLCMERNLLTDSSDSLLIDKSAKHSSESQNLLSNDYLNYHHHHLHQQHQQQQPPTMGHIRTNMPIPYVQNMVRESKSNNSNNPAASPTPISKFKWAGLRKIFNKGKGGFKDTQVCISPKSRGSTTISVLKQQQPRPSTLPLLGAAHPSSGISQLLQRGDQRSLEHFAEVFSSTSDLSRLKNPAERVKTPGDVPPSVRRTRGRASKESSARFSLYDDRMMVSQWGSAPDLEPPQADVQQADTGSVSSF